MTSRKTCGRYRPSLRAHKAFGSIRDTPQIKVDRLTRRYLKSPTADDFAFARLVYIEAILDCCFLLIDPRKSSSPTP